MRHAQATRCPLASAIAVASGDVLGELVLVVVLFGLGDHDLGRRLQLVGLVVLVGLRPEQILGLLARYGGFVTAVE